MGNNNGIVIFDVDDTLIKGQSQKIFIDYLFRKKMISLFVYLKIIIWFLLYKIGLVSNPKSIAKYSFKLFKGKTEQEIKNISKSFFEESLKNYFYQDALRILDDHKKNNRKIILLSNAIEIIIKEIAEYVEVENYICTKLEIKDGLYTGKIDGDTTFGKNKVKKLEDFLKGKNLSLQNQENWGYGDHPSDIFVLKLVKYPFIINPDKKMQNIANKNKWSILIFNK
ncbi:TPA: hypothetical protein DCZ46_03045 [Candidatus Campbellbacteria bacterium]|nr:MAG: HAD-superfamily hydrolase [Candidatus Campbellbacteria bacterium GW2011_OD1_34_28]KKP74895.1 MAG: HAD family hydrolase [Candidatus Campbellbacteria bacterium GW2011_GWD2_35_24]KKP75781.1 MAG: HAD family hydrolase [Candidatus Campbellbacteria bacterium GW2011_GWC2_35_28]KKP76971.1 MAG: HAD family hydrolase [Candidatus Campbellbacteria bacterium GW2011_GWC1_35_31]KKP78897.1 MAG: HAD family hydrolase [Candidatus Campbellbacteria bacterium GW2011_GWD1_35_49]HAP74180.1 hypothetical protein 